MPLIETKGAASAQGFGEFAKSGPANYIEDVFQTWLYTGNSTTGGSQTITNNVDLSTKGGLVWIKGRSAASNHILTDTTRGAGVSASNNNAISSNLTSAEDLGASYDYLSAFSTTGFTVTQGGTTEPTRGTNYNAVTYASWTFRKQPKFFDIVTYTGNGSNRTIAHNLGSVPGCIIIKRTDTAAAWAVYHRSLANTEYLVLNTTAAKATGTTYWNSTTPTATEFSLGTSTDVNANTGTYVAYLFAHDAGGFGLAGTDNVITCGIYTGNGSATGPTITLGYEPQWVMIKSASVIAAGWYIWDSMRGLTVTTSPTDPHLLANTAGIEGPGTGIDISPNATGFQITGSGSEINWNGATYIYIAIRRGPMKVPTDATKIFYPQAVAQAATVDSTNVPFPPDLVNTFSRDGTQRTAPYNQFLFLDRLRGIGIPNNTYSANGTSLISSDTAAENASAGSSYVQLKANGQDITRGSGWNSASYGNWIYYFMRRAPSFFDIVCYTGTGSNTTQTHNLGVVPELMIVKRRSSADSWIVYAAPLGATKYLLLETTSAAGTLSTLFNGAPTASIFNLGARFETNGNASTYVNYLFATCPGVSKVGSYTGTGALQTVNCGFTGGARFVLIKRTDSAGDWYVYDSARGISSGNDPYLFLNSTAAEVTGTNYVDTDSTGFKVTAAAPAGLNANGGTFVFLAVA